MVTALRIDARMEGAETGVLALTGEVDIANTQQVRDAALKLIAGGAKNLAVDLSATEYLDSAGLGTLVGLLKRIKERGGRMAVAAPQPVVRRLFEITGLNRVLPVCDDVGAALKEVGR